jgi:hypothetical protein
MVNLWRGLIQPWWQHLPTTREMNLRMRIVGEIVKYGRPACLTKSRSTRRQSDLEIKACGSYCSLSPARPSLGTRRDSDLFEGLPNNGGLPKCAFPPIGSHGPRRQARFQISSLGKYRPTLPCHGCPQHLNCAYPCATARAPWPSAIKRSIAEDTACRFLSVTTTSTKSVSRF